MSIQERIDRLRLQIAEQKTQRDWLLKGDWQDSSGDAETAAKECERIIELYEKLINQLEARP